MTWTENRHRVYNRTEMGNFTVLNYKTNYCTSKMTPRQRELFTYNLNKAAITPEAVKRVKSQAKERIKKLLPKKPQCLNEI
jgi:hypothetical protein